MTVEAASFDWLAGRQLGPRRAWLGRPVPGARAASGLEPQTADAVIVNGVDGTGLPGAVDEAVRLVVPSGEVIVVLGSEEDAAALARAVDLTSARLDIRALDVVPVGIAITAAPRGPGDPVPANGVAVALLLQTMRTAQLAAVTAGQDRGIAARDALVAELESEAVALRRKAAAAREALAAVVGERDAAREVAARAIGERDATRDEASRLAAELAMEHETADRARAERDTAREQARRTTVERDGAREETVRAVGERDRAREEVRRAAIDLDAMRAGAAGLESQLTGTRHEILRLLAELDAERGETVRVAGERDAAQVAIDEATEALATAERAHAKLSAEHEVVLDRLAMRAAQVEELRASRAFRLARLVWRLRRPFTRQSR